MEFKILVILSILIAVIFSIILSIFTVRSVYRDIKNTNLISEDKIPIIDNIPDTFIANSKIHGKGLFANRDFKVGEVLTVLDGMRVPERVYNEISGFLLTSLKI